METNAEFEFARRVEAKLIEYGLPYVKDPALEGVQADFVVESRERDSFVVIELKRSLSGTSGSVSRAFELAAKLQQHSHARQVLLVTPLGTGGSLIGGPQGVRVVNEINLLKALSSEFATRSTTVHALAAAAVISRGRLFAAMPFASSFDDVFFVGIGGAAEVLGLAAYRVDYDDFSGDVVDRIKAAIRGSRIVVADLTGLRPNVLYEMGYAHAINVPVVPIYADPMSTLPFDVSHENTLAYEPGRTTRLRDTLAQRLRGTIGWEEPEPG
jgi:hypothetical protein